MQRTSYQTDDMDQSAPLDVMPGKLLWQTLPIAAMEDVVSRLEAADIVSFASCCSSCRNAIKSTLDSLAPKSVLAMPFIGGCANLKCLSFKETVPVTKSGPFLGFSRITSLAHLTCLCLATSATTVWRGLAPALAAADLRHISVLHSLQVLNLSHQVLLREANSLEPLTALLQLTALSVNLSGVDTHLSVSNWQHIAACSNLKQLDISGCAHCYYNHSSSSTTRGSDTCSKAVLRAAFVEAEAAGITTAAVSLGLAPLHYISMLTRLEALAISDWDEPPSTQGVIALSQLPLLSYLDISRCMCSSTHAAGAAAHQPLLSVLKGTSERQQQQQGQLQQAQPHQAQSGLQLQRAKLLSQLPDQLQLASTRPAAASPPGDFSERDTNTTISGKHTLGWFKRLRQLRCCGATHLTFDAALWAELPQLTSVDLSGSVLHGIEGLEQLPGLQGLHLTGCKELDYDGLVQLLVTCTYLKHLHLQNAGVVLSPGSAAVLQVLQQVYQAPVLQHKRQQQHQPAKAAAACVAGTHQRSSSNSIWDAADDVSTTVAAAACPTSSGGLEYVNLRGCTVTHEGIEWPHLPHHQYIPTDPACLLYDLLLWSHRQLKYINILKWAPAPCLKLVTQVVPAAANTLQELDLSDRCLPSDLKAFWQGLACATALRRLHAPHAVWFPKPPETAWGTDPTAALLSVVAGMKQLRELSMPLWRFRFADFHVLAGLPNLARLDVSNSGFEDRQLWSLTHLTGLTWLNLEGAAPSNAHIWGLILFHLNQLKHLNLSQCSNFTSASVSGLLQLRYLTSLDIHRTQAGDELTVKQLIKLPSLKRLAMSVSAMPVSMTAPGKLRGNVMPQPTQQQEQQRRNGVSNSSGGVEPYAFLAELGQCQNLKKLSIDARPAAAEFCTWQKLPLWIDVTRS